MNIFVKTADEFINILQCQKECLIWFRQEGHIRNESVRNICRDSLKFHDIIGYEIIWDFSIHRKKYRISNNLNIIHINKNGKIYKKENPSKLFLNYLLNSKCIYNSPISSDDPFNFLRNRKKDDIFDIKEIRTPKLKIDNNNIISIDNTKPQEINDSDSKSCGFLNSCQEEKDRNELFNISIKNDQYKQDNNLQMKKVNNLKSIVEKNNHIRKIKSHYLSKKAHKLGIKFLNKNVKSMSFSQKHVLIKRTEISFKDKHKLITNINMSSAEKVAFQKSSSLKLDKKNKILNYHQKSEDLRPLINTSFSKNKCERFQREWCEKTIYPTLTNMIQDTSNYFDNRKSINFTDNIFLPDNYSEDLTSNMPILEPEDQYYNTERQKNQYSLKKESRKTKKPVKYSKKDSEDNRSRSLQGIFILRQKYKLHDNVYRKFQSFDMQNMKNFLCQNQNKKHRNDDIESLQKFYNKYLDDYNLDLIKWKC